MSQSPPNKSLFTSPIALAEDFITALLGPPDYACHDTLILRSLAVTAASFTPLPTVTTRLTVKPTHSNRFNTLHGGATAAIFDICTTIALALVRKEGFWMMAGVSRTLNVTYLEPVHVGEEVEVEATIMKIGKRLSGCTFRS